MYFLYISGATNPHATAITSEGEQVCYSYLFFTNEVKSYAENQDIADIRKIRQRKVGHKASDKYCDYCYDTLKNRHRYGGEDTALALRGGHYADNHCVKDRFCDKNRAIAAYSVVYRAYHCHCAYTDSAGCADQMPIQMNRRRCCGSLS